MVIKAHWFQKFKSNYRKSLYKIPTFHLISCCGNLCFSKKFPEMLQDRLFSQRLLTRKLLEICRELEIFSLDFYYPLTDFFDGFYLRYPLHKKWSFPWRISSVNVTKSRPNLVTFTETILNGKLHYLCGDHILAEDYYFLKLSETDVFPKSYFRNYLENLHFSL